MGKVVSVFAMSLDGFIADANDGVGPLFRWLANGDTRLDVPSMGQVFMTAAASADHYQDLIESTGALITGRRDFDVSRAWGGNAPYGVPCFIVSHSVLEAWAGADSPFTFVTEGVERAVALAREAADDKNVSLGGSQITRQALDAQLVDELYIDLVPMVLGSGIRLFGEVASPPLEFEIIRVAEGNGVTHLRYRVVKQ